MPSKAQWIGSFCIAFGLAQLGDDLWHHLDDIPRLTFAFIIAFFAVYTGLDLIRNPPASRLD